MTELFQGRDCPHELMGGGGWQPPPLVQIPAGNWAYWATDGNEVAPLFVPYLFVNISSLVGGTLLTFPKINLPNRRGYWQLVTFFEVHFHFYEV